MGPEHPETLATQQQIADAMNSPGLHAAAEAEYCALLAVMERCAPCGERVLGPEHPETLAARHNIAVAMNSLSQHAAAEAEAEAEYRAVLEVREHVLGLTEARPSVAGRTQEWSCAETPSRRR